MILVGVVIGMVIGWLAHKAYLRFLFKQMQRIKRAMRGGNGSRRRRR